MRNSIYTHIRRPQHSPNPAVVVEVRVFYPDGHTAMAEDAIMEAISDTWVEFYRRESREIEKRWTA